MRTATILITLALASAPALAQQIDPDNKFAWGENVGFLNFADAGDPPGSQSVFANPSYLEGFIWGENIGWINLGDGSGPYANTTGLNFGVNRDPASGHLSGFAWGENIGWVNFQGGALASPPNPARIEANRFRGYAWGENIGWINLDDPNVYVALNCPVDFAPPFGVLDIFDVIAFLDLFEQGDPSADLAPPFGVFDIFDVITFLALFEEGCP